MSRHPPRRRALASLVVIVLGTGLSGCATMANGFRQDVRVFSSPAGAELWVNDRHAGTTPVTIRVRSGATVALRFEKAGHEPVTVRLPRTVSGWIAGNAIALNPMAAQGMNSMSQWMASALTWFGAMVAVDVLSGGMFNRPVYVDATLPALAAPPPTPPPPPFRR